MPRLTNFNSKHGSVWHVCLCGSTIKWAELAIYVYVAVYPPNNSKIHNLPSCPSVVETTSRKKNKQQNPRIAGSQCVLLSTLQLMTTAIQLCSLVSLVPRPATLHRVRWLKAWERGYSLVPHPLTAVRCTREKIDLGTGLCRKLTCSDHVVDVVQWSWSPCPASLQRCLGSLLLETQTLRVLKRALKRNRSQYHKRPSGRRLINN